MAVTSVESLILDLPPSCIEFCVSHPKYFVVGTYNLVKEEQTATAPDETSSSTGKRPQNRNGSLLVFRVDNMTLLHVQTIFHPSAILDLHFCPLPGRHDILAVVSSTGTLSIFRLDPDVDMLEPLKHLATSRIANVPEGVLFLSGVWSFHDPALIALTTSTGEVRFVKLDDAWKMIDDDAEAAIAHSLEAWTVAFSPCEGNGAQVTSSSDGTQLTPFVIYSGGDDSALRYVSYADNSKVETDGSGPSMCIQFPPLKIDGHGAGVTAILTVPVRLADGSWILVTGSYDDNIRVFAVQPPHEVYGLRKFKRLAEENLGGGVWRLKLIDIRQKDNHCHLRVLASCMHAGARVIELKGPLGEGEWEITVLARFEEHKSMNYGSDYAPNIGDGRLIVVSTSFYDKLLCLWETTLP
ncbi:WD-40 repeat-containing protein [Colletotrichum truncatum]|uniref:WD-40 repeat-containing protein n=1 Tax=Colletotrichum truncatum TaxID=5467 RepID=A0ACC3Z5S7_COLTU|nr:WD-40 repeat-containing protein [Colletotrichum truncatum]KAF6787257.1 WD-40 repeat-containing protein [Colletotrichum truncatum]